MRKRKILKVLLILVGIVVIGVSGLLAYAKFALPNVPLQTNFKTDVTPERIARGQYLANHVCVCMDCHSTRDFSSWSGPLVPGTLGKGGEEFNHDLGFPGTFHAKNITPHNLKNWSDAEIYRAVTSGISKNGEPIFNVMPWQSYGRLDTEDIKDIIAYVRSLKPVENSPAAAEYDFPVNFIIRTVPQAATPGKRPAKTDVVNYGKYMFTAAACGDCHTKSEKGKVVGEYLAGGFEFKFPDGSVLRSPNITPDKITGIGAWTEEAFVGRFRSHTAAGYKPHKIEPGQMQTIMPWTMYGGMDTTDLRAMYAYLKTVKPVSNKVEKWTPVK